MRLNPLSASFCWSMIFCMCASNALSPISDASAFDLPWASAFFSAKLPSRLASKMFCLSFLTPLAILFSFAAFASANFAYFCFNSAILLLVFSTAFSWIDKFFSISRVCFFMPSETADAFPMRSMPLFNSSIFFLILSAPALNPEASSFVFIRIML